MKLILSRKGFDTSAGGCPNPIFPDGSMLALPIPDHRSSVKYRDVQFQDMPIGHIVNHLTKGRHKPNHGAHLDPDLIADMYPREDGWQPLLGQTGAAQGHLAIQQVGVGDIFLFFGLFRQVERYKRKWRFVPGTKPKHVLWGWLQIGSVEPVDELNDRLPWVDYHPHLHGQADAYNTLYIASNHLSLGRHLKGVAGSGVFSQFHESLCLTAPESQKPSYWQLPLWFYPKHRTPLTYHTKMNRWFEGDQHCHLQCAARGQEFVLNASEYPEVAPWLLAMIQAHGG